MCFFDAAQSVTFIGDLIHYFVAFLGQIVVKVQEANLQPLPNANRHTEVALTGFQRYGIHLREKGSSKRREGARKRIKQQGKRKIIEQKSNKALIR